MVKASQAPAVVLREERTRYSHLYFESNNIQAVTSDATAAAAAADRMSTC